ncbi:MAG: hypothetical protein JSR60_14810 [Proteobacteria bacterium]|nr:hypothetical protein [Pseudomonadota bacterium]
MSGFMLAVIAAFLAAGMVFAALTFTPIRRSQAWSATVTPLASIIGSGFLICGPLLAKEFGLAAAGAMAALLVIAYFVGSVIRFNIRHAEPVLAACDFHDPLAWLARAGQAILAISYAISVAYYLKLLAEFVLHGFGYRHELLSKIFVTALLGALVVTALTGGFHRVLKLAHATVSLKLAVIAGLLVALAVYWWSATSAPVIVATPKPSLHALGLLFGLLITVQGFETSRYLGEEFDPGMRIRTMRYAQWLSSAIYLLYIVLLTPFLDRAAHTEGVAGVLDIFAFIAPVLGGFVLFGAAASQISAAVADSIGAAGLAEEVSRKRLSEREAFLAAGALSVLVVWLTDPFQVVALASRAFAVYYAVQCAIAVIVSLRLQKDGIRPLIGLATLRVALMGLICIAAALAGAPAEGG